MVGQKHNFNTSNGHESLNCQIKILLITIYFNFISNYLNICDFVLLPVINRIYTHVSQHVFGSTVFGDVGNITWQSPEQAPLSKSSKFHCRLILVQLVQLQLYV